MLLQRVLTATALLPLVVGAVLWLPNTWFGAGVALFAAGGAWEWGRLAGWSSVRGKQLYTVLTVALAGLLGFGMRIPWLVPAVLVAAAAWWLVALAWVVRFQQGEEPRILDGTLVAACVGWLVVLPTWLSLVVVHGSGRGPYLVLLLLVFIWVADTGAYFAGRLLGRHRLASRVSPGKTWEGVGGGMAAVVVAALVASLDGRHETHLWLPGLGLLVVAVSVVGDLAESLFKRRAGCKDSGALLPGHGGVLDRIDSLTAAAPMFALVLYMAGVLS